MDDFHRGRELYIAQRMNGTEGRSWGIVGIRDRDDFHQYSLNGDVSRRIDGDWMSLEESLDIGGMSFNTSGSVKSFVYQVQGIFSVSQIEEGHIQGLMGYALQAGAMGDVDTYNSIRSFLVDYGGPMNGVYREPHGINIDTLESQLLDRMAGLGTRIYIRQDI